MGKLKCGAAEACITPPLGLYVPGYFEYRAGTGVKSDLYAHALAVENDGKAAILISVDIIVMGKRWTRAIRRGIAERIGVPPQAVMVSATHIHTGGPFDGNDWNGKSDAGYRKTVVDTCVNLAVKAYESRVPAKMGWGEGEETRISFCRNYLMTDGTVRTNPGGRHLPNVVRPFMPIDYSVGVLRFDDLSGKPIAQVVNFACHPDTVGGTELCADYPGEMRKIVKKAIDPNMVVLFFNGCCGNINHVNFIRRRDDASFKEGPEHYRWMGECLAETVLAANATIQAEVTDAKVGYASHSFRATRRQPSEADLAWAREIQSNPDAKWNDQTYARGLFEMKEHPRYYSNVEVQAIGIGDVGFVGFPCEPFNDIGTRVKEHSPFAHNMMAELSNGHYGYWVTEPTFSGGPNVYEARLAADNSAFAPSEADKMEALAGKLLQTIYEK